jgi:hypothetical protein
MEEGGSRRSNDGSSSSSSDGNCEGEDGEQEKQGQQ